MWQELVLYTDHVYLLFPEKATDGGQASENWAMFMEICDVVNETEDGYVIA